MEFPYGRRRIAVRTEWQFGIGVGDASAHPLKGNHLIGNEGQGVGKTNRTYGVRFTSSAATYPYKFKIPALPRITAAAQLRILPGHAAVWL